MNPTPPAFWSVSATEMLAALESKKEGLTGAEAKARLSRFGPNRLKPQKRSNSLTLLVSQFKNPIILILFFATGLSFFLHDPIDAFIILAIVLVSGFLGFWQERGASNAVEKLLSLVRIQATVLRDGLSVDVPVEEIVPGDMVVLNAGDVIPGDALIDESNDLFIDEAILTGETFPVEKAAAVLPPEAQLGQRSNALWMGTHVVSGSATALIVNTGAGTEFGKVSERLKLRPLETEFQRGIRQFGNFLMEVTLLLVVAIFAINVFLARPVLESFLFSLALAVGLTPQLLPAIISINLAHGARRMAEKKVIVKRLASIENFGSMNVICSDKTGTLTEGTIRLDSALDAQGAPSDKVLLQAYINAFFETGFTNPLDLAILNFRKLDLSGYQKLGEIPYDFLRKRLSILVSRDKGNLLVAKGALKNILSVCTTMEGEGGKVADIASALDQIERHFEEFSGKGFRVLGVAYRDMGTVDHIGRDDEAGMTFSGFLVLSDPLKPDIAGTIVKLKDLGVALKIITGDNHLVAANIGGQIGLKNTKILTGPELVRMSDAALLRKVGSTTIFAEIEPNQKERIIIALKKAGNVVGYMGDGINDASAIHAADVGISVDDAVDVAKDAADIVLLEKDLAVLVEGVREGRATFANTLKYVFMATSANFGNMFSMACLSLFLPFLPLLPKQVLLINLMTDFPEMTIATDNVDEEMINYPRRWDIKAIRKFMITFGAVSSAFDFITFGLLLLVLHVTQIQFRTGWFLESVVSASMIVLVIRSRKVFYKSRPGKNLFIATLSVIAAVLVLPFTPLAGLFGFSPLPILALVGIVFIVLFYIATTEAVKKVFYKKVKL
jgi:Mg2+-importing ATPase